VGFPLAYPDREVDPAGTAQHMNVRDQQVVPASVDQSTCITYFVGLIDKKISLGESFHDNFANR
jgi:hypothetical protein